MATKEDNMTNITIKVKECTKCGEVKPLSEYGAEKKSSDGKRAQCKKCRMAASKAYYAQTSKDQKEQWKANARTKYWSDLEKSRAERRCYHCKNKDRINTNNNEGIKRRRAADPEKYRALARAAYLRNHERKLREARRYVERHKEEVRRKKREQHKIAVQRLADWYVRMLLDMKDAPEELIGAKRELVRLRRVLRDGPKS